ncbi:MAG: AI-2E family transporter [Coleofasciculus sp. G3-WIS-01]|uniref:AI-2E family transporter n=1 Tax=Coleofasciculus sp. G3-WIS-01 TaxID=3069528 RepID=UPI0032F8C838
MRLGSLLGLFFFIISVYILWRIKTVILLGFAAVVFATTLNRLVRFLLRFRLKRTFAVIISVGFCLGLLAVFFVLVVPPFVDQVQQLIDLVPIGLQQIPQWANWVRNVVPDGLLDEIGGLKVFTQDLRSWATRLFGNFFDLFYSSIGLVLNMLLVGVVTIMLLANPEPYRQVFILLFPAFYRHRVQEILDECEDTLGGWAVGILFNMMVIAIFSGLGLWILQVQLPLANGLLAGIFTFIPNLGPTLSVIPPVALALLDSPWKAVAVVVLYIIIQQIESNILTPLVMQRQVSLLPAVTLLSQMAFAIFFGILGLFLALPIVVVAQVFLKEVLVKDILNKWK